MALPEGFLEISNRVRNWGRWGDDDQLGTLNFITCLLYTSDAADE